MDVNQIKNIANIGAGTMGHATALQFAMHGYHVTILDSSHDALEKGMDSINHDIATFQKAGLITETLEDITQRISITTDYEIAFPRADFVIESVIEDLKIKQNVWQHVEEFVSDNTILATNTSGLSPTAIQSVLKHPERFVVAHFWNPAQLMPLVEIVPGEKTNQATMDLTEQLIKKIGKHGVPLQKESLGFVGNRIQLAVIREALHIVDEGIATPAAVDDIIKYSLGRRWSLVGPIASADLGGLDIFRGVSTYLYDDLANDTGVDPVLNQKVKDNNLGLKTGHGFFDWHGEDGQKIVAQRDQALMELLKQDKD